MIQPLYKKSLNTLEFNRILDMLCECAVCTDAKGRALLILPYSELGDVAVAIKETTDARGIIDRRGAPPFYGMVNIIECLHRANLGSVLVPKELLQIAQVLKAARLLLSYCNEDEVRTSLDRYFNLLVPNKFLEESIANSIISEDEISDNASRELADIRRKIKNTNSKIRDILNKIIHSTTYQKYLQDPIISMRGDRHVIPVRQEYKSEVPGIIHDTSSSGATVFVEPMSVVEANNELRVLISNEEREIERILFDFSSRVAACFEIIKADYETIVDLDVIFAKGKLSKRLNCCEPKINADGYVDLKRARHPLIDAKTVVPIDISIGGEFNTLVITGPNTGGKTVALKTLGLICVMACAGLHIPAYDGSEIAVFSNVFADIGDEQSIEQSLSTFSSHMKNIVEITKNVDRRSLVLFDELGAGTDPIEGAALAIAILEEVRGAGAKVAATTHYSELKVFALSTNGVENASCEFDVETLRPTYRLLIGIPGKSNAFAISKRLGLSEHIVQKAKERINTENVAFEDILGSLDKNRKQLENEKAEAEHLRSEIEQMRLDFKRKKDNYEKTRDNAISQAKIEARRIIEQARASANKVVEELEELKKQKEDENSFASLEQIRTNIKRALEKVGDFESPDALKSPDRSRSNIKIKKGDTVTLLNLDRPATVLKDPDSSGDITVQAGIMKIKVNLRDIRTVESSQEKTFKAAVQKQTQSKKDRAIKTELDIRGLDAEEAIYSLDKFVDDAYMSGLLTITVIHGKGTGTLRTAVHQSLKNNENVKDFRLGRYGEGETGVTIIELK